jgi:hypothetical protein
MSIQPDERRDSELRSIETLIVEHVQVGCDLVQVDAETWAIQGNVVVDGREIIAEFGNKRDAEAALERISAARNRVADP